MGFNVATAFEQFCSNLRFSDADASTISNRYHSITKRINNDYWDSSSDTSHSLYVGSYGRDTEISTSDIDKAQILEALGASEPTPDRLLERLNELCEVVKAGSANSECNFTLSTIHSSKGLEYDRVILMDVVDGILPKMAAPAKDGTAEPEEVAAYEEERRLFYVGMTRAKKELFIFRFRKAELCSAFAKTVFPDKSPTLIISATHKSGINTARIAPVSEEIKWIAKDYIPGSRVSHKSFGSGRLTVRNDDIITVRFDDGTQKRFSLSAALQKNLFSLL